MRTRSGRIPSPGAATGSCGCRTAPGKTGEGVIWAVRDPIYKTVREKGKANHTDTTEGVLADPGYVPAHPLALERIHDCLQLALPRGIQRQHRPG